MRDIDGSLHIPSRGRRYRRRYRRRCRRRCHVVPLLYGWGNILSADVIATKAIKDTQALFPTVRPCKSIIGYWISLIHYIYSGEQRLLTFDCT